MAIITIHFNRSSVCYADDIDDHYTELHANGDADLSFFIHSQIKKRLPLISGGKATWVLCIQSDQNRNQDIAVIAQQWNDVKLLVEETTLKSLCRSRDNLSLFAKYWQQENPEEIFQKLQKMRQ